MVRHERLAISTEIADTWVVFLRISESIQSSIEVMFAGDLRSMDDTSPCDTQLHFHNKMYFGKRTKLCTTSQ